MQRLQAVWELHPPAHLSPFDAQVQTAPGVNSHPSIGVKRELWEVLYDDVSTPIINWVKSPNTYVS